ncbi:hypothetical protein PybrP1_001505 [[Pythium] brassicae (nom. inval.)]|nr:hypothetical protein PybrP1_001505 [[Pythium] brassicae (nom. inval.)]
MRLPATITLVLLLPLLWFFGSAFTPAGEAGGVLALSVADAILVHIRPWVYVTAGFYHPHLVQLVVVLPLAFGLAKRVEPELGAANLGRLLLFANTMASFRSLPWNTSVSGFAGGITAMLVAFMRPTPHATAPIFPGLKLRFYPLVATTAFALLSLLGLASSAPAVRVALVGGGPFSALGGYFGWFYLRFLNRNADQSRGDVSDEFALVVLLPDALSYVTLSPIVGPVANFAFSVVKLCGYLKNRSDKPSSLLPVVAETSDDPIAERRKARALKALDEKLAKLATARDDIGAASAPMSAP